MRRCKCLDTPYILMIIAYNTHSPSTYLLQNITIQAAEGDMTTVQGIVNGLCPDCLEYQISTHHTKYHIASVLVFLTTLCIDINIAALIPSLFEQLAPPDAYSVQVIFEFPFNCPGDPAVAKCL